MRTAICVVILVVLIGATGCTMANGPILAPVTFDLKGPKAMGDPDATYTKEGRARAEGILIFGTGDASIAAAIAASNPPITRIHHVDCESLNILGLYSRYETIVYGE